MSRARNIKPGFFKNDHLAECEPLARLLFAGLWCEADREGRLEDRPKRLKADCLPYDDCDVDALLNQLAGRGFIVRYAVEGVRYISIPEFGKHQNPHRKESASSIPAPVKDSPRTDPASDVPEPARLIPDSPSLIPDSLQEPNAPATPDADASAPADPIWGTGLSFLRRKGIPEKAARSLLGKLRQAAGDVSTGSLLAQCEADDITDPAPWLMAAAQNARAGPRGGQPSKQTIGLAGFLGVDPHDLNAKPARTVVHAPDRAVSGELVLAGPGRRAGG